MADIFLNPGEVFTGVSFRSNFYGRGGAGMETAGITNAALGSTFDQNIEAVRLGGSSFDFTYQQQGNQLLIFTLGEALVATISVQDDADGTRMNFTNGYAVARFDGTELVLDEWAGSSPPTSAWHIPSSQAAIG